MYSSHNVSCNDKVVKSFSKQHICKNTSRRWNLNFPECCKNFPSCSFLFIASVLRLGLIHLKVEVQSAVHPCVGKHWSTAQNCGRLHNFGGLKPQNNQRLISTVAHYYKTGQGKTTEQYVWDKPKHGTLQHPIYQSKELHPALLSFSIQWFIKTGITIKDC